MREIWKEVKKYYDRRTENNSYTRLTLDFMLLSFLIGFFHKYFLICIILKLIKLNVDITLNYKFYKTLKRLYLKLFNFFKVLD